MGQNRIRNGEIVSQLIVFPAVGVLFGLQRSQTAIETDAVVTGNYAAALGALPFLLFPVKKLVNAVLLNVAEVFDWAHVVASSISFIQCAKPVAGKFFTLIAEVQLSAIERLAISPDIAATPGF